MSSESLLLSVGRYLVRKLTFPAAIVAILAGIYLSLSGKERYAVYVNFFEKTPPTLEQISIPPGVGLAGGVVKLRLEDTGTGLDEVIIRSDQDGEIKELLRKRYSTPQFSDLITVEIPGREGGLLEGMFDLNIAIFDRAFWSNAYRAEIPLQVSFVKPKLEVLSVQHNAVVGGAELCFYRISDLEGGVSGVSVGDLEFKGYPARLLDAAFEAAPDIHFAFFAIPLQYQRTVDKVRSFARNRVGNQTLAPFYYKARPVKSSRRYREVSEAFLVGKLSELADRARFVDLGIDVDPAKRFNVVFSSLRKQNERAIRKILLDSGATRSNWEGAFLRPQGASLRVDFGEIRDYRLGETVLGSIIYTGAEYSAPLRLPVLAAAPGKVIFAGELPLYGKSVILDHGFGLSSLYGFLDSIRAEPEADLPVGAEIGRVGMSGFQDSPGILFEMRIGGVPVRPIEWWDARWVREHITNKINEIKKQFNLLPSEAVADE